MGNHLVWEDRYNIGVDVIDKEHKNLFKIINKLFTFVEDEQKSKWACQEGIKYFKTHAVEHFLDEENYMESIDYNGFQTHKRIHDDFREKTLPVLEMELEESDYLPDAVSHFLGVCTGWLIGHTLIEDHAITGNTESYWQSLMSKEESEAMEQAILELLYEMFLLKPKMVSESYSGEKFGKGIYYRMIYESPRGKKWETILVWEEKLLVNTIGRMLDMKSETLNVMIMNATRYTARQFVECIIENFHPEETYTLISENLLTYDQFKKVFERENPQFSFLFDTGEGYFAYCAVAPHLVERGIGTSLQDEDEATAQIEKYLSKNEREKELEEQKKKILVVDDSSVMLQFMKELLGEEYDLDYATSGLSAIRSLILNRPDLVLLDYEMPVCDGRQVLEMMRSEEDIADIPVIFLTSKVDKESITKVLSLKPEGYLSKRLKPEEIKKNVDEYFQREGR